MKPLTLILHHEDGETEFIKYPELDNPGIALYWDLALDWEFVIYEKIYNGERLVIDNKTVGILVYGAITC